jgi:hypothetical protein
MSATSGAIQLRNATLLLNWKMTFTTQNVKIELVLMSKILQRILRGIYSMVIYEIS